MEKSISREKIWEWLGEKSVTTLEKILKNSGLSADIFFAEATAAYTLSQERYRRKNKTDTALRDMRTLTQLRIDATLKKKSERRQSTARKIERNYYVITALREKKASWVRIAKYLSNHHDVDANPSYIYKVMKKLGYEDA